MKIYQKILIFVLITVVFSATGILGRANSEYNQMLPDSLSRPISKGDNFRIINPDNQLPNGYAFQYTDEIASSYDCFGTFGAELYGPWNPHWDYHFPSFMTPRDGNQEYLFVGGLWIGGIIGEDTLVCTGTDGWMSPYSEFYSGNFPYRDGVTEDCSPADYAINSEFFDTLDLDNFPAYFPGHDSPYIPLNLRVVLRNHAWYDAPNSQTIIYDMIITNVGDEIINEGRIGLFFDADISDYNYKYSGYKDDISGSIREKGIAYAIDNDGDPIDGLFDEKKSPTRILAVKFIESSFEPQDTIFNWWVSSSNTELDFGPRQKGTDDDPFREFYNNNLGYPNNDKERYYLLSHPEWDYDQIMTTTIETENPNWCEPNPEYAADFADGGDTQFLFSIGPVDIKPDSSIRVLFATFTGENVHTDVNNLDNLPDNPEQYLSNLDFSGVLKNADISDSLGRLLLNPLNPVNGLKVEYHDKDSAVIRWDPWVFGTGDVDGYEVYLSTVPFDQLPYPGTIPPWLAPEELIHHASIDNINKYTLTDINIDKAYFVNVASKSNGGIGDPGGSIIIFDSTRAPAPIIKQDYVFGQTGDEVTIEWDVVNPGRIDHFNIYKFDSLRVAENIYHPYYRDWFHPYIPTIDSMWVNDKWYYYTALEIYDTVNRQKRSYTDHLVEDGSVYRVTSIDINDFESEFSEMITFHTHTPPNREILLLTDNLLFSSAVTDTVRNFYNEVLAGYDYDIAGLFPDSVNYDCNGAYTLGCVDWRLLEPYKLVIMDARFNSELFWPWADEKYFYLTKYLLSGGKIAYFGMLYGLSRYEPIFDISNNAFLNRFSSVDSIFNIGTNYYKYSHTPKPYIDTVSGFIKAESIIPEVPDIDFDTSRYPFPDYLDNYWPRGTAPGSAAFVVNENGQTTHLYRSKYPETSRAEGYPVGVKTVTDEATTYLYGFHLWYMEPDDARELINFITGKIPTDIDNNNGTVIPKKFELNQNYPNPFNASTDIKYSLPLKSDVIISIYNILGQRINLLIDKEQPAGNYIINWDGTDSNGRPTASGIYLYQIKAGDYVETKKMVLLK